MREQQVDLIAGLAGDLAFAGVMSGFNLVFVAVATFCLIRAWRTWSGNPLVGSRLLPWLLLLSMLVILPIHFTRSRYQGVSTVPEQLSRLVLSASLLAAIASVVVWGAAAVGSRFRR